MSAFFERVRAALATKGYEVLRELGTGGMGIVVLARQIKLERLVAVKVIRPELHTALAVERFAEEGRILAGFSRPNIVPVYEADEAEGLPYYAMQYLSGETVASRLQRGPIPRAEVRKLGRDLLDALGAAHTRGVIHRDVKPSNVFWDGKSAVLVDFGIAKRMPPTGGAATPREPLTNPGERPGTRSYMAPELFVGVEADARSDIYAAGMVIYEAMTGRHWDKGVPKDGDWSEVPWLMKRVLQRSLALDPAERWPDATSFRRALWRTRIRRYQRNAVGIGLGGAAVGLLIRSCMAPTSTLRIRVDAASGAGSTAPALGDSIACALAHSLDRYPELSSHCVAGLGRWWPSGSHVRVELASNGDALHIRLHGSRVDTLDVRGPRDAWRALSDTLADRVFGAFLGSEGSLETSLPRTILPKNAEARSAFRRAEEAFSHARYGVARAAYAEAAALDSTCWLCYWRHAEVGRWFDLEDDPRDSAHYYAHRDLFPEYYQRLIRVERLSEAARLDSLDALTERWRDFLFGQFRRADEILHRGPLVGRSRREALQSFQDVLRVQAEFVPALGHLAWLYVAEGDSAAGSGALARLEPLTDKTDASYASIAVVQLAFAWRFFPASVAQRATDELVRMAAKAGIRDLDAGARYLAGFGSPQGELAFSDRLRTDPRFGRSANIGRTLALVGMGRPDTALALAEAIASGSPELEIFADELAATLMMFDPEQSRARWLAVRAHLQTAAVAIAGPTERRQRAAFMLAAVQRAQGGNDPPGRPILPGEAAPWVLSKLLLAQAAAGRGAFDSALSTSDSLTWISAQRTDDPFFRTILHMERAAWREHARYPGAAKADLLWHENSDLYGYPTRDPQPAEVDWALAPLAQWKLGALLLRTGGQEEEACRAYRAVARLWAGGEPAYRARADSAAQRITTLHCKAAA